MTKRRRKISAFLRALFLITQILLGLGLMIAVFSPRISPQTFWPTAFLGLGYPLLLAGNTVLLVFWGFKKDRMFIYTLIVLIIGCSQLRQFFQWNNPTPDEGLKSEGIRILTYNVRLFDYYNWTHRKETKEKMMKFLQKEQADIVCLQEFFSQDTALHIRESDIRRVLGKARYSHIEYTAYVRKHKQHFGIATYSSYPVIRRGKVPFEDNGNNICIYTDVVIHGDTVRIYNMHLQSLHFGAEDYHFLENPGDGDQGQTLKDSRRIAGKLKNAFQKRAHQADLIRAHMDQCPYLKIICGDFNDSPISYAYHTIADGLTDDFHAFGKGWGKTYVGLYPAFRIDYILHSPEFTPVSYEIGTENLSDHYPVMSVVLQPSLAKTN